MFVIAYTHTETIYLFENKFAFDFLSRPYVAVVDLESEITFHYEVRGFFGLTDK